MAAMSTVLTVFDSRNGSRVNSVSTHTVLLPRLVVETRKVAEGNRTVAEYAFRHVLTTVDADTITLPEKVSFEAIVRTPIHGVAADVTTALATFRDIVAGDEFANSVTTQEWLI